MSGDSPARPFDGWPARVAAGAAVVALILFVVLVVRVRGLQAELERARAELHMTQLANRVGVAALEADAGRYERARRVMSSVFTELQNRVDSGASVGEDFREALARRDALITALSRSEPVSRDALEQLFLRLQGPVEAPPDPSLVESPPAAGRPAPADTSTGARVPGQAGADTARRPGPERPPGQDTAAPPPADTGPPGADTTPPRADTTPPRAGGTTPTRPDTIPPQ